MKKKIGSERKKDSDYSSHKVDIKNTKFNNYKRRKNPKDNHMCIRCNELKLFSEYGILVNGHGWFDLSGYRRKYHCRDCDSINQKNRHLKEPWKRLFLLSKRRAIKNALPFDLTCNYIKSIWPKNNKCPVTKKEFLFGVKNRPRVATLDKILPNKGYVIGNVVVVSHMVNAFKSDIADIEVFKDIYDFYKSLRKVKI